MLESRSKAEKTRTLA